VKGVARGAFGVWRVGVWACGRVGVWACRVAVDGVDLVDLVDAVEWVVGGSIARKTDVRGLS
jgi:hypothetical protein